MPRLGAKLEVEPLLCGGGSNGQAQESSGERRERNRRPTPGLAAVPPPWKRRRRRRSGPQHHAPRGDTASQIARPYLECSRRIAGSNRDRAGLLAREGVGAEDSRAESPGRPQEDTFAAGDPSRVVDVLLLGHVGGPRNAVEPALRAVAIPFDPYGPRHRALGPIRQPIAR